MLAINNFKDKKRKTNMGINKNLLRLYMSIQMAFPKIINKKV